MTRGPMTAVEKRAWSEGVDVGIRQARAAKDPADLQRLVESAETAFKGFEVKSGRPWAYAKGYWFGLVETDRWQAYWPTPSVKKVD